MDRWVDKEDLVLVYNGVLLSYKHEWNDAICSNMHGPRDYHTKTFRHKANIIWYHLYLESKKWYRWTFLQNRNKVTDVESKLTVINAWGKKEDGG